MTTFAASGYNNSGISLIAPTGDVGGAASFLNTNFKTIADDILSNMKWGNQQFPDTSGNNGKLLGVESGVVAWVTPSGGQYLEVPVFTNIAQSGQSLLLDWNNVEGISDYNVKQSLDLGSTYESVALVDTNSLVIDSGVLYNKSYLFKVRSETDVGLSEYSQPSGITTNKITYSLEHTQTGAPAFEGQNEIQSLTLPTISAGVAGYWSFNPPGFTPVNIGSNQTYTSFADMITANGNNGGVNGFPDMSWNSGNSHLTFNDFVDYALCTIDMSNLYIICNPSMSLVTPAESFYANIDNTYRATSLSYVSNVTYPYTMASINGVVGYGEGINDSDYSGDYYSFINEDGSHSEAVSVIFTLHKAYTREVWHVTWDNVPTSTTAYIQIGYQGNYYNVKSWNSMNNPASYYTWGGIIKNCDIGSIDGNCAFDITLANGESGNIAIGIDGVPAVPLCEYNGGHGVSPIQNGIAQYVGQTDQWTISFPNASASGTWNLLIDSTPIDIPFGAASVCPEYVGGLWSDSGSGTVADPYLLDSGDTSSHTLIMDTSNTH